MISLLEKFLKTSIKCVCSGARHIFSLNFERSWWSIDESGCVWAFQYVSNQIVLQCLSGIVIARRGNRTFLWFFEFRWFWQKRLANWIVFISPFFGILFIVYIGNFLKLFLLIFESLNLAVKYFLKLWPFASELLFIVQMFIGICSWSRCCIIFILFLLLWILSIFLFALFLF